MMYFCFESNELEGVSTLKLFYYIFADSRGDNITNKFLRHMHNP